MKIASTTVAGNEITVKSAETVNQINQMIVDKTQDFANKMIRTNTELKLQDLKQEGVAQQINVLA